MQSLYDFQFSLYYLNTKQKINKVLTATTFLMMIRKKPATKKDSENHVLTVFLYFLRSPKLPIL
ncbi:hypothetical protein ELI_2654 [Eubacterium callanderi]|uniref:Uncharacterized protein n=1 Tax=Eubacterium callanderi TaxID=53442 RepID=E3GP31_9FIRM|nr:hypothetical protein ELI_2654 [Eubacterium callanderi]